MNQQVQVVKKSNSVLVFDVETTGLIPKMYNGVKPTLEQYPHIIQLSFVVYNIGEHMIDYVYNAYIDVPEHIEITSKITEITGITSEICRSHGVSILEALMEFNEYYTKCDHIVSHNLDFDRGMICAENLRNHVDLVGQCPYIMEVFNEEYERQHKITTYCTMRIGKNICNIMVNSKKTNPDGSFQQYKKYPKLSELYENLFNKVPVDLHNSLIDTIVCLRCFMKMWFNVVIDQEILAFYGLKEAGINI